MNSFADHLTAWEEFCIHAMRSDYEKYQQKWLKEKENDDLIFCAFDNAGRMPPDALFNLFESEVKNLEQWISRFVEYEKIADFIISYWNIFNIKFDFNSQEWNGNNTFNNLCEKDHLELADVLCKHASMLDIDFTQITIQNGNEIFKTALKNPGYPYLVDVLVTFSKTWNISDIPPKNWNGNDVLSEGITENLRLVNKGTTDKIRRRRNILARCLAAVG